MLSNHQLWLLGLAVSILVALGGIAELVPHPWHNVLQALGTVGASVNAYLLKSPFQG